MSATRSYTQLQARRARVLASLKSVLPATARVVVLNGHEFKVIDTDALADEFGFHRG